MNLTKPKILVVDDSFTIRVKVAQILKAAGYKVLTANDGASAIQLVLRERPALMILDVKMPKLDGYGVCEHLKRVQPATPTIPIVFLTSLDTKALELLGQEFGAYLKKPVDPADLLTVVEKTISEACI